jgi:DDE superfamily endonuclease
MRTSETARAHRFATYVEQLATVLGHRDRHDPLRAYVTGLCLPGDRKSIEPMAARVDPRHVRSRHQSMHHFIADAPWDAAAVLRVAREWVLGPMVRHGPVAAWIVDEVLALDPAGADASRRPRPPREAAVAHRARLSGTQGRAGLDHFEGRGWRGFHHHGALCIAAYAYLAAERARLSPLRLLPSSVPLAFPKVSRREALPVRPERHVPTSIATAYELLARALLQHLPCRSCGRAPETG